MSWKNFKQVTDFINERPLNWMKHSDLKYIEIRLDTRDMGCIVKDRDGNLIDWDDFKMKISRMREEDPEEDDILAKDKAAFYGKVEGL